ncbi:hypothetical protein HOY82DRAFT_275295 [Tuber indicum]|nr:hypothetical protein HOY82DRAFT_275295 [Tuber indicum]
MRCVRNLCPLFQKKIYQERRFRIASLLLWLFSNPVYTTFDFVLGPRGKNGLLHVRVQYRVLARIFDQQTRMGVLGQALQRSRLGTKFNPCWAQYPNTRVLSTHWGVDMPQCPCARVCTVLVLCSE